MFLWILLFALNFFFLIINIQAGSPVFAAISAVGVVISFMNLFKSRS